MSHYNSSFALALAAAALLVVHTPAYGQGEKKGYFQVDKEGFVTVTAKKEPAATEEDKPVCPKVSNDDKGTKTDENVEQNRLSSQVVQLHYLRKASEVVAILNAMKEVDTPLKKLVVSANGDDKIMLYGASCLRSRVRRAIALLDLPQPSIEIGIWGIQISSNDPGRLTQAMSKIYAEINESQQLLRLTYKRLEALARDLNEDGLDEDFTSVLTKKLGYSSALDRYRPLSITDILIRLLALKEPRVNAQNIVSSLEAIFNDSRYKKYVASMRRKQKQPFENYLRVRGMEDSGRQLIGEQTLRVEWSIRKGFPLEAEVFFTRMAVLEFALNYGRSISDPNGFSPYYLQTSADKLNSRLQPIVDALNQDIQDMFVEPTLEQIELIAREVGGVDYARVGRTTVAGLSGMKSEVLANTVSVSDTSQPLRLSTLLAKTSELAEKSNNLFPVPAGASPSSVPVSTALGLLGALSEDRTLWRELTAGTSLKIMPFVLRDSTSAELHIDLTVSAQSGTVEQKVRPLSQVSQNNINTTVYVGALDLFALSTFTEQSTVDGGRTYVPVIGTIWEGLFSGVPVFGDLFSWKNSPKTIYHQSLVLSNTFINPTAMGLALLYPRDSPGSESEGDFKARFKAQCKAVIVFKDSESRKLNAMRNSSSKLFASSTPLGCELFNKESTSSQVSGQAQTSP